MKIRIDECGDFDFSKSERFWVAAVAGVVIPDDRWSAVEAWVNTRNRARQVEEMKASELGHEVTEVVEFLAAENIVAGAIVTDSKVFPHALQVDWRERQYEIFEAAAERSVRAQEEPEVAAKVERLRRRMNRSRHVSQPDYLQYAVLMPWLLSHLMSAALLAYSDPAFKNDSWIFDIILDEKEGADPGKAGELLRDSVEAIFASDPRTELRMPAQWSADHPFRQQNTDLDHGVITVPRVLSRGIRAAKSHLDPGLQLADTVAHIVWRTVRNPDDQTAIEAARKLSSVLLPTADGWPIKVWSNDNVAQDDHARYMQVNERLRRR